MFTSFSPKCFLLISPVITLTVNLVMFLCLHLAFKWANIFNSPQLPNVLVVIYPIKLYAFYKAEINFVSCVIFAYSLLLFKCEIKQNTKLRYDNWVFYFLFENSYFIAKSIHRVLNEYFLFLGFDPQLVRRSSRLQFWVVFR